MKMHFRSRYWMPEDQGRRMQRLSLHETRLRMIQKITDQRMPGVQHMNADLMRPSGLQADLQEREIHLFVISKSFIARQRVFTFL